ncbi:hypothetical protein [Shinella sp. G-2]|uniref:hypothetical protein n=1 Tax=Shinella sp. G-2 TaxID=3133141 RepID=UPI003CFE94B8
MRISLSPQMRDDTLQVVKYGDVLIINGEAFDFSSLPDGATIPVGIVPCNWFAGPVERIDGVLHIPLGLPCGPSPSQAVAFPEPLIDPPDGPLELPADPPPPVHFEPPAELSEEETTDVE